MVSVMREKKALFWWKSERLQRLVVIMKSVLHNAAAALLLLVAPSAFSALAVGDLAPRFVIEGALDGKAVTVDLLELVNEGPLVIYFFPSAFTDRGASLDFAKNIERFHAAGTNVVGVSRDSIDTLTRFSSEVCGGLFPVASATESLVNAFDVNDGAMFNTRTTYVVDSLGKIVFVHDDQDYRGHVEKVLDFLQAWKQ